MKTSKINKMFGKLDKSNVAKTKGVVIYADGTPTGPTNGGTHSGMSDELSNSSKWNAGQLWIDTQYTWGDPKNHDYTQYNWHV